MCKKCEDCTYYYEDEVLSDDFSDFWMQGFCWRQLPMYTNKCNEWQAIEESEE